MSRKPNRTVLLLGKHGQRVRVFYDLKRGLWTCRWREKGVRHHESYPGTSVGREECEEYAQGVHERLTKPPEKVYDALTLRDLWERYWLSIGDDVRAATTAVGYRQRWGKFETYAGLNRLVSDVDTTLLDGYRKALAQLGHVPNQVRLLVASVRRIVRWGVHADQIPLTKSVGAVLDYRVKAPRGNRALEMHEYRREEAASILAHADPETFHGWRPYVLIALCSMTGRRARSLLHLEWRDIDLAAGAVHWRPEIDKMWQDQTRPLPNAALAALEYAYHWHEALGSASPFVFFAVQERRAGKPWTYQAAAKALHQLEALAGVAHIKWRAYHGFRRGVTGDLLAKTGGNYKMAADYIGDRDLRVVRQSYDKERADTLTEAAALLDEVEEEARG